MGLGLLSSQMELHDCTCGRTHARYKKDMGVSCELCLINGSRLVEFPICRCPGCDVDSVEDTQSTGQQ